MACNALTVRKSAVSVSFTHAAEDAYRVYFDSPLCAFTMSGRHQLNRRTFPKTELIQIAKHSTLRSFGQ